MVAPLVEILWLLILPAVIGLPLLH